MSHNRYRIPARLRASINEDLKTSESLQRIPRCRKTIRKKTALIAEYKKRSSKVMWLGTHLWAAKRMKMEEYFGYKVALNPNDKSDRACYRFSNYGCCLMNLSFYETLLVHLSSPADTSLFTSHFQQFPTDDHSYVDTYLYLDSKLVCPVIIYRNQLSFYVFYHPAARPQIDHLVIPGTTMEVYTQKMEIYRLMGPEALDKLDMLLDSIGYMRPTGSVEVELKRKSNPNFYEKNLCFPLNISNCKCENKLVTSPSKAFTEYIKEDYEAVTQDLVFNEHSHQSTDSFWKEITSDNPSLAKF